MKAPVAREEVLGRHEAWKVGNKPQKITNWSGTKTVLNVKTIKQRKTQTDAQDSICITRRIARIGRSTLEGVGGSHENPSPKNPPAI